MEKIRLKRATGDVTLSQNEVECIVYEWYINGMIHDNLSDESGNDLEEILNLDDSIKVETVRDDE